MFLLCYSLSSSLSVFIYWSGCDLLPCCNRQTVGRRERTCATTEIKLLLSCATINALEDLECITSFRSLFFFSPSQYCLRLQAVCGCLLDVSGSSWEVSSAGSALCSALALLCNWTLHTAWNRQLIFFLPFCVMSGSRSDSLEFICNCGTCSVAWIILFFLFFLRFPNQQYHYVIFIFLYVNST